jgi:sigma-B regulation protein RsbU (phosphoserine phosphatase)
MELVPRDEVVGTLRVRGEAPDALIEGLQSSVTILLREVLDKHDLAHETLERYRELNLLYRASETIGACLNAAVVPGLLLAEAKPVIPFDSAVVLLGDEVPGPDWQAAESLISTVRASGRPDYTENAMAAPIRIGESVLGMVVLGRSAGRESFNAGEERLLLGLASQAGVALERARLHEQETRRLQLEEELAVARRIQLTLLPAAPPTIPGWSFAASYQAARQVGGDLYDFLDHALGERHLGLVVADVTGKGVPAALMMAYSRAVLRAESMAGRAPLDVLANANRQFLQERQSRLFLSAFHADLDLDSGVLTYANAGHDAPLWIRADGDVADLEAPGAILGAFYSIGLESDSVAIGPGDAVILYTDGVTEARNHDRELFSEERLRDVAAQAAVNGGSAQAVLQAVLSAVSDFTAGAEQADDLTIVVAMRDGVGSAN